VPHADAGAGLTRHGHCPSASRNLTIPKGSIVNLDQETQDIRDLFDWSNVSISGDTLASDPSSSRVGNDDLKLALKLLACNSRDREQFLGSRGES
jgi:hypothetical protein